MGKGTPRAFRTAALSGLVLLWACGGGGPSGPAPAPTVSSIAPPQASPGERIIINGANFGTEASAVSVTVNGAAAQIVSVTSTAITAIVPAVAPGAVTVVVTVSGRASSSASFSVLRGLPTIVSVSPTPARAGGTLTITGQNFVVADRVRPAGSGVQVLLDDMPLTPILTTSTTITIEIPLTVAPGMYALRVQVAADVSAPFSLGVEVFTVTGTYLLLGSVALNTCPPTVFDFAVGDSAFSILGVRDSRPSLMLTFTAPDSSSSSAPYLGTLMPDGGFDVRISDATVTSTVAGRFSVISPDDAIAVGSDQTRFDTPTCEYRVDFLAVRVSTTADRVPASRSPQTGAASAREPASPLSWTSERPRHAP